MQNFVKHAANWILESTKAIRRLGRTTVSSACAFAGMTLFFMASSHAQTMINGPISTNAHWTASGGPYVISGSVAIQNGAVLSIDAGVTIFMEPAAELSVVAGSVKASGIQGNPIRVRSDKTRQGGAAAPGDWKQWSFLPGTTATQLDYVEFENGSGLLVKGSAPVFNNLNIHHQLGAAITVDLQVQSLGWLVQV